MFGNAISPVIVGDLVVVNFGPGEGARLVAVDKRTGAVAWEAQPLQVDPAEQTLAGARLSTPAAMIANPIVAQGDKNDDGALSNEEMVSLATTWFDKLDTEKSGKLTREQFAERLGAAMPPPPGAAANAKADPALANALFSADADKDGSLTRDELKMAFAGWHAKWSGGKDDVIDANQVLDGLNTLLP